MKKNLLPLFFILIVFSFSSCTKIKREYYSLTSINLQMIENITPEDRSIYFHFYTIELYSCLNYLIRYDFSSDNGNLTINLRDVEKNDLCINGQGPATANMNLGKYDNGTYQINLTVAGETNTGTLEVSDLGYVLHFQTLNKLNLIADTMFRIPENIFWGYVAYPKEASAGIANQVLDSLESHGASPHNLQHGYYGYFTIKENGEITLLDKSDANFSINFIYKQEDPDDNIKDVIRYFNNHHLNEVYIFVRTSKGLVFNSPMNI